MTKYHDKYKCNKCGEPNKIKVVAMDDGVASEVETECYYCEHQDYWSYGWFESGNEIISKSVES